MDKNEQLRIINRRAGDNLRVNVAEAILKSGPSLIALHMFESSVGVPRAQAIDSSPCPAANRTWMTDAEAIGGNFCV